MSTTTLDLPTCPATAYQRDYAPHLFYCDLPLAHDGRHAVEVKPGVWATWTVTLGFESSPPALGDWPATNRFHPRPQYQPLVQDEGGNWVPPLNEGMN